MADASDTGPEPRQRPALPEPPDGLARFPRWALRAERTVWRAHHRDRSPWWFASTGRPDAGRFDLPAPQGTCYLAATGPAALRERFGERLVRSGHVLESMAAATLVSALHLPMRTRLADTCSPAAASFGVTRELAVLTPYSLPQRWAAALRRTGHEGIRYLARFSTGPRDASFAVFGPAGGRDWPLDPAPRPGRTAAAAAGIDVLAVPYRVRTVPVAPA